MATIAMDLKICCHGDHTELMVPGLICSNFLISTLCAPAKWLDAFAHYHRPGFLLSSWNGRRYLHKSPFRKGLLIHRGAVLPAILYRADGMTANPAVLHQHM